MKKYMFAALFALVFAVPGMAEASPMPSLIEMANPESDSYRMDPQLVQDILKAAANHCEYSYTELQGMYDDGTLTIDKVPEGYRVTLGGGHAIIMIDESL
jgi:arginase family enzyme